MHKTQLEMMAKEAAGRFLEQGQDLCESIFQLSGGHGLNDEQTQRVVEMANTYVNGHLVKQAKANGKDPRRTFKMASLKGVKSVVDGQAKTAGVSNEDLARVAAMFTVPEVADDGDEVMTKIADFVDTRPLVSHLGSDVLAKAYLHGQGLPGHQFTLETMAEGLHVLDDVVREAKLAAEQARVDLECECDRARRIVEEEMRQGTSPKTLKKIAGAQHEKTASTLIDEARADMGDDAPDGDGELQITDQSIVDERHGFPVGLRKIADLEVRVAKVAAVAARCVAARDVAARDVAEARRAGSEKVAFLPAGLAKGAPGHALNALGAYSGAKETTERLKKKQMTPVVGPMKMARFTLGDAAGAGLALAGATLVAGATGKVLDAGVSAIGKVWTNRAHQQLFAEMARMDPNIDRNPRAREAFDIITKFAPGILKSPRATYDFIQKQLQYPVSSTEFLQQLAQFQKLHRDGTQGQPGLGSAGAQQFVSGFAGGLKKG